MVSDFDLGWKARDAVALKDNAYLLDLEQQAFEQAEALHQQLNYLAGKISKWGWDDYLAEIWPSLQDYERWRTDRAERI